MLKSVAKTGSPALPDENKWRILPDKINNKGGAQRLLWEAIEAKKRLRQVAFD